MSVGRKIWLGLIVLFVTGTAASAPATAQQKPNILVIMGDDIGYWNISAYNRGMMGYRTPNIDRIANEGAIFTDYYGQQSCTAGRAAFITGQSPHREAMAKFTQQDLEKIIVATLTGMTTDAFDAEVKKWLATAKDPRWKRSYTELTYQPMLEVMSYLRANGYKTFIVTGFGQDFVRVYAQQIYDIPPEQAIGSALAVKYAYAKDGKPILIKEPKLMLNDNNAGKPEGIHLEIGRRPYAAFGNSTGDRQMLEYTKAGDGTRLSMIVLHDDAQREYAYGPAQGLPDTKVGTFTQALYDEAKKDGWIVISMKNDWNHIFAFE